MSLILLLNYIAYHAGFNTEAIPNAIKLAISSQHSIISEFDSQKRFYQYFKYLLFFLHVSITIER